MARAPRHSIVGAVRRATTADQKARDAAAQPKRVATHDGFVNFAQRVGRGSGSPSAQGGYGLYPLTRFRIELEWAYRGSWIVRAAVDDMADDMVRAGIDLGSDLDPKDSDKLARGLIRDGTWLQLNEAIKWGRLYGGAIVVPIIDGQDLSQPLLMDRVRRGQYKGVVVLDRWQLFPSYENLVTAADNIESTAEIGLPRYYTVIGTARALPGAKIHYSRAWRMNGDMVPYWQQMTENLWNISVIEPLYDRLIAFDSATQGAAQLVYRAYLRTLKLKGLTDVLGQEPDSPAYTALTNRVTAIRDLQASEGLTVLDSDDELENQTYTFAGLSEIILQFGEQIAGAIGEPLVRLFGQSPAGLNSTGESDWRNWENNVHHSQELELRMPLDRIIRLRARSSSIELPDEFWWEFSPLYQMTYQEKATTAQITEQAVADALEKGVIKHVTALKEFKKSSKITGIFTNITDEDIKEAEEEPPVGQLAPGEEDPPGETSGSGMRPDDLEAPRGAEPAPAQQERPRLRLVGDSVAPPLGYDLHGLPIFIETPAGKYRSGLGWKQKMVADYGYIRMTGSAEGAAEGMDCFVGPDRSSKRVWIVNQVVPDSGEFDEHKLLLAFDNRASAIRAYLDSYGGFDAAVGRIGSVRDMTIDQLKIWLQTAPVNKAA